MFHIDLSKAATAKTLSIAAALLALPLSSAFAQSGAYGVSSNVQTLGVPGGWSDYSNGLPLDAYEYRESDPAGGHWGNQPSNTVWADAAARGWAQPGELKVKTDAAASHLSATSFSNSYPYGFAEVRYWDTVTVASDSLPAGTPVTLVFRSDLEVAELDGEGLFAGTFYGSQTFHGRTVSQQVPFSHSDMDYAVNLGLITVSTKVGARFTMSGRLYLTTRAYYYQSSPRAFDGAISGEVSMKAVLESASADAHVVADSGAVYRPAGI